VSQYSRLLRRSESDRTRVADACVVNLDSHLVSLGRRNLNILNGEVLASFPGNGGLAGDCLKLSVSS
jgi:hypothetical protein